MKAKDRDWVSFYAEGESDWALLFRDRPWRSTLFLDDTSPCEMRLQEQAGKLNERIIASKNEKSDEKLG